jgi:hypothetical protein
MAYRLKLLLINEIFESDLRTVLFWAITERVVTIPYRRFGTAYRYQLIVSRIHIGPNFKGQEYKKMDS